MNTLHALAIALLQGATEMFPVSSLGHAVVVPALLGWNFDEHAPVFLPFLVMLHLGTAAALLAYFWQTWWELAIGLVGISGRERARESRYILLLLVIATVPAVLVGGIMEHAVRRLFETPITAAIFLVANGILLISGEHLRRRSPIRVDRTVRPIATLSKSDAIMIGIWQCLALLPGVSRSGATIVGGLLRGIDHETSARFSFLIALPVILGATALEVPKLLKATVPPGTFQTASMAAVVAGVTALVSTALLMKWFRGNDKWALDPFGYYCIVAGLISGVVLYVR
jgi:undecaprenyl-diphosphatase